MQKNQLEELLKKHSQLTSLESCGQHWISEGKSLDWYLGFLQSVEIHKGIRELFAKDEKQKAYEILGSRVRSELAKFVPEKNSLSNAVEGFIEFFLSLLIARLGLSLICEKLANLCDKANQEEMAYLFGQGAKVARIQKGAKKGGEKNGH